MKIKFDGLKKEVEETIAYSRGANRNIDRLIGFLESLREIGIILVTGSEVSNIRKVVVFEATKLLTSGIWTLLERELLEEGYIDSNDLKLSIKNDGNIHFGDFDYDDEEDD